MTSTPTVLTSTSSPLDVHVFRDAAGVMGRLVHDLGNVYQAVKTPMGMSTRLFWALVGGEDRRKLWEVITKDECDDAERRLNEIVVRLGSARMDHPDAALIADEIRNGAAMLHFACHRRRHQLGVDEIDRDDLRERLDGIIAEHRRLWLSRNRPGGLHTSVSRMDKVLQAYAGK